MKKKVRVYKSPDGNGKYINKTAQFLGKMQTGGQPSVDELGYPGAAQEAQATSEEQLMQVVYQDISNDMPYEAIVAKLVNGYNLDPAVANQFVQQVYSIIENKIDKDKSDEAEEEEQEESSEVKDIEQEILSEKKPMSKIQGHTDLAMEDEEEDFTDLEDEDMLQYGGTPRFDDGGEQDYVEAMNNDQTNWPAAETPIVMPDVSEYLPFDMSQYLENDAAAIAWQEPTEDSQEVVNNEEDINYSDPVVDPSEFRMGGFKTKKGYVNSVMKLVKKQTGGDDKQEKDKDQENKEQDVKASDADPRGADLRKNRLDAFLSSVKNEGNLTIAKEQAEKQFDQMKAMHEQMMIQQPPMQQFIPEDYEGIDEMQFGGQQRRAMRRMNRALRRMPIVPGIYGPVTKFDVHRTGIFGGPKEYTIEFGQSPLMQLASNPLLSSLYGYGRTTKKKVKTPGKLITEKVRNTINNESTKQVANATKSEAAAKSAWDLDQNLIPDNIQSNIIESKIKTHTPQQSVTPANNSVEDIFRKNPPRVGETNSAYLLRTTGNPGFYNNTDVWNGTEFVKTKQGGGPVNDPSVDPYGNLQRFIDGGYDPSQEDIDDVYSKDTSDPYMPKAARGGFWGALLRNYVPANFPQRQYYSQMMRGPYSKATGQQFAGIPGFNPNAQIKDIQVTKQGIFGRPKQYTVTYNNNPSGRPEDRKLAYRDPKADQKEQQKETSTAKKSKVERSNTEGLKGSTKRAIRRGERRTARQVARGMEEFPETYAPQSNISQNVNSSNLNAQTSNASPQQQGAFPPGDPRGEYMKSQLTLPERPEVPMVMPEGFPINTAGPINTDMAVGGMTPPFTFAYGGDLSRFIPQALLGKETPVTMANNPANSVLKMPIKSSKDVGQQLMMDSRKKLEGEAKFQPDEYSVDYKAKKAPIDDLQGAILTTNAGIEAGVGMIDRFKNKDREAKMYENLTADNLYASDPSRDRGDYSITGSDYGLYRSADQGQTWNSRSAQYGGTSNYSEGDEVEMTEEELEQFLANGGEVEYLNY